MEQQPLTLQDIANIISFLAPGYFAMQVYATVYTKRDRVFSRLFVESIIYSLPIVAVANVLWQQVFHQPNVSSINGWYALLLLGLAVVSGAAAAILRRVWPVKQLAMLFGFGSPFEDFVKTQLLRIDAKDPHMNAVTVRLHSGAVFSGTIDRLSRYSQNGPMFYCFGNLAWLNEKTGTWDERDSNLIIARDEIEYIETKKLRDDRKVHTMPLFKSVLHALGRLWN